MLARWFGRGDGSASAVDPDAVGELLAGQVAWWAILGGAERRRVVALTLDLVERFHWEAAKGFDLTEPMRAAIAAQGALMLLGLGDEGALDNVGTVIVHRGTVMRSGERSVGGPVIASGPIALAGEAHHHGPVLVSWRAAQRDVRRLGTGTNVVIHELAHKLDMLDGILDGTPPLGAEPVRRRWVEVCEAELARLRRGEPGPLRPYAATNPAEFFAVASEVFFDRPLALVGERPQLYDVLRRFYGQDTAARVSIAAAGITGPAAPQLQ